MHTAVLMVVAMILTAPLTGYLLAMAWAAEKGLIRKEALDAESIAMSFH